MGWKKPEQYHKGHYGRGVQTRIKFQRRTQPVCTVSIEAVTYNFWTLLEYICNTYLTKTAHDFWSFPGLGHTVWNSCDGGQQ
jgi:hypothetical protein